MQILNNRIQKPRAFFKARRRLRQSIKIRYFFSRTSTSFPFKIADIGEATSIIFEVAGQDGLQINRMTSWNDITKLIQNTSQLEQFNASTAAIAIKSRTCVTSLPTAANCDVRCRFLICTLVRINRITGNLATFLT